MNTTYAHVSKHVSLTHDEEVTLWQEVMSCLDDHCVKPECRQTLENLIRDQAHVIVERENELMGQFVAPDVPEEYLGHKVHSRFLYVWLYKAGYSDEAGIADEYSSEEFDFMQTHYPARVSLGMLLAEDHAWS